MGFVGNRVNMPITSTPYSFTFDYHRKPLGPLAMVGARWRLSDHVAVRADLSYAYFDNKDSFLDQPFNLTFSGLMIRPAVEWTF